MRKSNNPSGRPKGSRNKKTAEHEERIKRILSLLDERLHEDIEELTPSERIRLYASLCEFVIPKLARKEYIDHTDQKQIVTVVRFSPVNNLKTSED